VTRQEKDHEQQDSRPLLPHPSLPGRDRAIQRLAARAPCAGGAFIVANSGGREAGTDVPGGDRNRCSLWPRFLR
jgi:hypothetical protein